MKRTLFIISIILLGGISAYLAIFRTKGTISSSGSKFAINDPSKITRIIIEDSYNKISIVKEAKEWKIGNIPVDQQKITDALLLASYVETKAPAPIEYADSITACLQNGANVTFYQGRKIVKAYTLCKYNKALYARNSNSQKLFRISVRGHSTVDLTAVFNSKIQKWRENIIIDLAPSDIKEISINYKNSDRKGFILQIDSTGKPFLFDQEKKPIRQYILNERIEEYVYFFSDIQYYEVGKNYTIDEITHNQLPFISIAITLRNSDKKVINGYKSIDPETKDSDPAGFYAIDPDLGIIFLKYIDFDPILVEQEYFLKN